MEIGAFASRLGWLSTVSGIDLIHLGTEADDETIKDTAIAQPLLVATGFLVAGELFTDSNFVDGVTVTGGHSVGEITAAILAGVFTPEQGMVFVRERGLGMAEAAAIRPTSMAAVIGGETADVVEAIESCGLTPANHNGKGQIVAAGTVEQLDELAGRLPARTRLIPLSVAGAFHTAHMAVGHERLAHLALGIDVGSPGVTLLSNRDGQAVESGAEYLDRLVEQVISPVRWDLCMATMASLGVTGLLELAPAGTLTGIAKRNMPGVELFSLNTPDQLDEARTFVASHATKETAK